MHTPVVRVYHLVSQQKERHKYVLIHTCCHYYQDLAMHCTTFFTTPTIVSCVYLFWNLFLLCELIFFFKIFLSSLLGANRRHGMTKYDMSEAANASSIEQVSHSELLSYSDYIYLCDVSFYFQHQQQQNLLSLHDVGQVFIQVKEGGGHSVHPGHITFDEFLYAFALLSLAMSRSVSEKYGLHIQDVVHNDEDMIKALLHRMSSCPGIMNMKMRCYSKFKHIFQDMYREDDKPWRYLNVPGAPERKVSPKKVMRRMSLTASGHFVPSSSSSEG